MTGNSDNVTGPTGSSGKPLRIPPVVWTLGFVSLLMDISSEMIHGLLPVYLITVLGTSATTVGFIEGIAEATASITKIFSGSLSDWLGRRHLLAALGYGVSALTKPIFPLASSVGWVVAARFIDRIGKGIRGAPRDALIADVTPPEIRGAAFGLRQSLDTVGAATGPLLAIALMTLTANNFRHVFWIAVLPAVMSFLLIAIAVRDAPSHTQPSGAARPALFSGKAGGLPPLFWAVVIAGSVLTLARVSEAFLILRAEQRGLAIALTPLVLVVMNLVYTFSAYPLGKLADRFSRLHLLVAGALTLALSQALLASASGLGVVWVGIVFYGLHLGLTQGLLAALVAGAVPAPLRGTAFGMFNLIVGVAMLLSGVIAGSLWDRVSPSATFALGGVAAILSLLALWPLRRLNTAPG